MSFATALPSPGISRTERSDIYYQPDGKKPIAMNFRTPLEMLAYADDRIGNGEIKLHVWQAEVNEFLASKGVFTKSHPLRFHLRAANGSGKDAYVIAAFAVWYSLCIVRSRFICTSSSKFQIKHQTESYIRTLCEKLNSKLAADGVSPRAFIIKTQHIICTLSGSETIMFVTDDEGNIEGYHPFPDCPTQELCVCLNEAKSVAPGIFAAMSRCTYSHWLEISSPGQPSGDFYNNIAMARKWEDGCIPGMGFTRKITSYDCPHIAKEKIEQDKLQMGELSALFRSKHLAEFTSIGECIVISEDLVDRVWRNRKSIKEQSIKEYSGLRGSFDTSGGGDEQVFTITRNNVIVAQEFFHISDSTLLVTEAIRRFKFWDLKPNRIRWDDGGVGKPQFDMLRKEGWDVIRVGFGNSPINTKEFANRGTELWFNFLRLLEFGVIKFDIPDDANAMRLLQQLKSRYYRQSLQSGKPMVEPKKEAKLKGHGSPDRADSLILGFSEVTVFDFQEQKLTDSKPAVGMLTTSHKELAKQSYEMQRTTKNTLVIKGDFKPDRHRQFDYLLKEKEKFTNRTRNPISIMQKYYR